MLNDKQYGSMDNKCNEINRFNYLCSEQVTKLITSDNPCEVDLIKLSENYKNCEVRDSSLASRNCSSLVEKLILNGTYIVTVPNTCSFKIENLTYKFYPNLKAKVVQIKKQQITNPLEDITLKN